MLKIKRFVFNQFYENTFVVYDDETNEAAVIDPGCNSPKEEKELDEFIIQKDLQIKFLINTHCHIDHIFGNAFVKEKYNPRYYASYEDLFLLDLMVQQSEIYGTPMRPSPKPDTLITENEQIQLGSIFGKFIFTPGHSPGGSCIYFPEEKILFSGDTLFKESIGRTDLWGGDYNTLIKSIKEKLFILPDDTIVYPGHESDTTIGYEKLNNQFI